MGLLEVLLSLGPAVVAAIVSPPVFGEAGEGDKIANS